LKRRWAKAFEAKEKRGEYRGHRSALRILGTASREGTGKREKEGTAE